MDESILEIKGLVHRLRDSERPEDFTVTVEGELKFKAGSLSALLGKSGCGKTTLLSVLGLLRQPTELDTLGAFTMQLPQGEDGVRRRIDIKALYRQGALGEIEGLRRAHLGFALQSGELHPALTVWENVSIPLYLNNWGAIRRKERVRDLLRVFQLDDGAVSARRSNGIFGHRSSSGLGGSRVHLLSGGEYQRVALARSIAHFPSLLFVDEPTANLDQQRACIALTELRRSLANQQHKGVVVMITHDEDLANDFADTIIEMESCGSPGRPGGRVRQVRPNSPRRFSEWSGAEAKITYA